MIADYPGTPVSPDKVGLAKYLMGFGASMQETAIVLKVRSADLDRSLWTHIGTPVADLLVQPVRKRRQPKPDFE